MWNYFSCYIVLFFMLVSQKSFSNESKTRAEIVFDSIYFNTATVVATADADRALQIADSLYNHAETELQQIRAMMLTSTIFMQKGNAEQAIVTAVTASEIAEKNKEYEWQARIAGFLSTQFRLLGLTNKGLEYLDQGIRASKKLLRNVELYSGLVAQERACYEIGSDNIDIKKAVAFLTEAAENYKKLSNERDRKYFLAVNEGLYGDVYIASGNFKLAIEHYNQSLTLANEIKGANSNVHVLANLGLGKASLELADYNEAIKYLMEVLPVVEGSETKNAQIEVYKALAKYYKKIEDFDRYAEYNTKYIDLLKQDEAYKRKMADNTLRSLQKQNEALKEGHTNLIIASLVPLIILGGIFVIYRNRTKKKIIAFESDLKEAQEKAFSSNKTIQNNVPKKLLSLEIEEKIMQGLETFEAGEQCTSQNMSLSVLAGIIGINAKYLSHALNKNKNKDFNSYINELRIEYIISKLKSNPEYRNYKISYLAEDSGFSSHSKFTSVFKTVTGYTPSEYIDDLSASE